MRCGANKEIVSSDCFRLLSLISEVQNDVVVAKLVLEELEVMRLSCSLGMLSSVSLKEFEAEMLRPEDFDSDFALFLRKEVFGAGETVGSGGIKVVSLFGKQEAVTFELKRGGYWSDEMEMHLHKEDQGIFCVSEKDVDNKSLIVFSWIHDDLFRRVRLRDTATYVLRFLTCLSPDVICCLSRDDVNTLNEAVASMNTLNVDVWKSFSVAFHVEKQEQEKDSVSCTKLAQLSLAKHRLPQNGQIVKGTYPAYVFTEQVPATKCTTSQKWTFYSMQEVVTYVIEVARQRNMQISFVKSIPVDFKIESLKAAAQWPESELEGVSAMLERSLQTLKVQSKEQAQALIEDFCATMFSHQDRFFSLDFLIEEHNKEPAFVALRKVLDDLPLNRNIWSKLDYATQMTLLLPSRLRRQLKTIALHFHDNLEKCSEEEVASSLAKYMQDFTVSDKKLVDTTDGIISYFWNIFTGPKKYSGDLLSDNFRKCMEMPLQEAHRAWSHSVAKYINVAESALPAALTEEMQKSLLLSCEADKTKLISDAFTKLRSTWREQHKEDLTTTIRLRCFNDKIICDVTEEQLKDPTDQLNIFKLERKENDEITITELGKYRLGTGSVFLKAYTVKNYCLVLVTILRERTVLECVDFSIKLSARSSSIGKVFFYREFPRNSLLCDFDALERVIAFAGESGRVVLYRFNQQFTTLEIYKQVELSLRTSLTLPAVELLLVDGFIYATDANGMIQSVNVKNQQSSRAVQIQPLGLRNSSLFALADNMALGFVRTVEALDTTEGNQCTKLYVVASDDFRNIPVIHVEDFAPPSNNLCVQIYNDLLVVVNEKTRDVIVYRIVVTVKSESFQIRHSKEHSVNGNTTSDLAEGGEVDHWLRAFYHLYEKFPVRGLIQDVDDRRVPLRLHFIACAAMTDAVKNSCRNYFQILMRDLRKLNKPLCGMDLTQDMVFETEVVMSKVAVRPLRRFLLKLVTFVPIQICRAEANSLTIMTNGEATSMDSRGHLVQAVQIARSIRFGLLSPLLESWPGRCVAITSMGKQSTGKSYLLNHLTGSSFAIAGARCTDGAWMSAQILPKNNVLLVTLDFEGLGSFERTEQEDVFLSVLNASISMLTIFRMEMRFDKDIDDLFGRFQKGVPLFKGDPRLFRGKLYMSVKDVNSNDQQGVMNEFATKIQKLVSINKDSNFLVDLYCGQLDINCSPPLGTIGYYQSLIHAQNYIENSLCAGNKGFQNGKKFLDCIRLVLAKIAILDWTSLDASAKQFQLSEINSKLPGLIRTGCILPFDYKAREEEIEPYLKENMVEAHSENVINVDLATLSREYPTLRAKWEELNLLVDLDSCFDWNIDVGFDCCSAEDNISMTVHESIKRLYQLFLTSAKIKEGKVLGETVADFDIFLSFFVRRRKARISMYVKQILGGIVPDEWKRVEQQYLGRFQILLSRCQSNCNFCRLGCMKGAAHPEINFHDCGTDHKCAGSCEYCNVSKRSGQILSCAKEAGHEGRCECLEGDHTCGKECCMAKSPNCGKRCSLHLEHSNLHKCDVAVHACGAKCSAQNCRGQCVLNIEEPHTAHKCVEIRCTQQCVMDGCNEICGTMNHFHGQADVSVVFSVENAKGTTSFDAESSVPVIHMCSKGHECQAMCDEKGICRVDVFLKQSLKTFKGVRDSFQYSFQEMNGARKKCSKLLPPGQQTHSGTHSCDWEERVKKSGDETMHYCDVRCPCCSYFCRKNFNHHGPHATSHGNMRNTFFLSDTEDINVDERKYKAGELGIAEMCNLYCSKMGREHVHYLNCDNGNKDNCVYTGSTSDQRRHCTRTLEPKPEKEMDEILHQQFWKTLGWEDPCTSKAELELFNKCGYKCDAPDHDDKPSYCVLPAWHKSNPNSGFDGFTYVKGHKFDCSHVSNGGKMHHVFVLDCSGSMNGQPWADLMAAWKEYIYNRISYGASLDLVSVVTFDNYAQIEYEARNITTMTTAQISYRGGGTSYATGLRSASEVLSRMNYGEYKPAIIFFSDGHPCDAAEGERLAAHIRGCFEKNGLQAYAVGFGSKNLRILERVAEMLGGTYHQVLTGNEVKTTFHDISASLSTRAGLALSKPDHERNCVICAQDLASGETVKLDGCSHEFHKVCMDVIVRNDEDRARCPSCRRDIFCRENA